MLTLMSGTSVTYTKHPHGYIWVWQVAPLSFGCSERLCIHGQQHIGMGQWLKHIYEPLTHT